MPYYNLSFFFFFNDTATTEIYTLSLHDALPISRHDRRADARDSRWHRLQPARERRSRAGCRRSHRSEEHTSELQSPCNLVCRLLLEKKKKIKKQTLSELFSSFTIHHIHFFSFVY